MEQAATQTGAEVSARAEVSAATREPPSITDRLKAHLSQSEPRSKSAAPQASADEVGESDTSPDTQVDPNAQAEPDDTGEDAQTADGQQDEVKAKPTTLKELAEALGVDVEDIYSMDLPTKVDGKEGPARLRDIVKSHQLEQHLNQKSMAFADEKKAFELEIQRTSAAAQQRVQHLDAALQVGQRLLDGEFANVKWDELQASDPLEFNQKVVNYQQRQHALNHLAQVIGQERTQQQEQQAHQFATWRGEQLKLLQAKLPEWNDNAKRSKDVEEMATVINEAYGVTPAELKAENDHRLILIARDAWKWQQLQKAKPDTLNKVKAAPKLLKPGTTQSRAAQDGLAQTKARDEHRRTGSVGSAANALKKFGFA